MVKQLTKEEFEKTIKFLKDDGRFELSYFDKDSISMSYYFTCTKGSATCLLVYYKDTNRYYID